MVDFFVDAVACDRLPSDSNMRFLALCTTLLTTLSYAWVSSSPLSRPLVADSRGGNDGVEKYPSPFPNHRKPFRSRALKPLFDGSSVTGSTEKIRKVVDKNFFLLGMFAAVGLARLFPTLGATTAGGFLLQPLLNLGISAVFLLSGLSLELSQLTRAFANAKLNLLIQMLIFGAWPILVGLPLVNVLGGAFPKALLDGILIMTCLPTTVNMCVILTSSAGGNVAAALCNAGKEDLGMCDTSKQVLTSTVGIL